MSNSESTENRRPLQTRNWAFFRHLADRLAKIGVSPNAISMTSVLFACGSGVALASTSWLGDTPLQRVAWLAAGMLIQLRLIANLLDGMVAIEGGQKSAVGELYNEVPDRLSDPAILVGAGFAASGHVILGLLAAMVALFVAYVRALGASVGVGQIFLGPMAKPQRMAVMTVTCVYCAIAPTAWQPRWIGDSGIAALALLLIILGGVITAARRLSRVATLMKSLS